jgi:hypothetical protein
VAVCLHGGVQGGVLLHVGGRVGGSGGLDTAAVDAAYHFCLGNATRHALSALAASVGHEAGEVEGGVEEQ